MRTFFSFAIKFSPRVCSVWASRRTAIAGNGWRESARSRRREKENSNGGQRPLRVCANA